MNHDDEIKEKTSKVAVVTGSNKGIGFAIVKGLCESYPGTVYLTARDVTLGQEAVETLKALGLHPEFHQLDINDVASIKTFRDYLHTKYGGIDLLVNNAAIAFKQDDPTPFAIQAENTIDVNYFGLLRVCKDLVPLLKANARLVNLSSSAGHLLRIPGENLRKQFVDANLTEEKLSTLMNQFVAAAKDGKHEENGWGSSAYVVSKVGVSAYTFIQQKEFDANTTAPNIIANAVHPGYVDTDMTNHKGPLTIEQGATAPLFLALQPITPNEIKGKYVWCNKKVVEWDQPLPSSL